MSEKAPEPGQIVGRMPAQQSPRSLRNWLIIGVATLVWFIAFRQWSNLLPFAVIFGLQFAVSGWVERRPPTVVDRSGIRRPGRLRRRVAWSQIDAVAAPEPGAFGVRLVLANGKHLRLDDIPAAESAAVAALGDRRVLPPPRLPTPPPRMVLLTDQEIRADVARRAADLAVERSALEAERLRITPARRPQPPPASPGADS